MNSRGVERDGRLGGDQLQTTELLRTQRARPAPVQRHEADESLARPHREEDARLDARQPGAAPRPLRQLCIRLRVGNIDGHLWVGQPRDVCRREGLTGGRVLRRPQPAAGRPNVVAPIRLQHAQGRQVRLGEVVETLQDPGIDFRFPVRAVPRLEGFDGGQRFDGLLRLRILLGIREG